MKKKIVSTLLCAAMVATMVTGCGSSDAGTGDTAGGAPAATTEDAGTDTADANDAAASEEGKVLNIYC